MITRSNVSKLHASARRSSDTDHILQHHNVQAACQQTVLISAVIKQVDAVLKCAPAHSTRRDVQARNLRNAAERFTSVPQLSAACLLTGGVASAHKG